MKWLNNFSSANITYYIYKLNKNDFFILDPKISKDQSFIILNGIILIIKVFSNKKYFPLIILNTNNIISLEYFSTNSNYYYKLIALDKTYILSFSIKDLKGNNKIKPEIFHSIIDGYHITLTKYEIMNSILVHKLAKHRIIQLILFLSFEFGTISNKKILIPFSLSQKKLALITKSNKITVNKIIKHLCKEKIIKYLYKKIICIINIDKLTLLFYQ
uniref:Global nitrogen transcriptional regulator n=1 Tax=Thuretia quercifolia TaxID=189650 RepID=A0A1Z1ML89_9FLOR|nr:global nitrogen transcriptional regulator [Thuretia quercifolia]ARW66511.1 global nitrogen transcriptional regulator [Thuretia quercifolia]